MRYWLLRTSKVLVDCADPTEAMELAKAVNFSDDPDAIHATEVAEYTEPEGETATAEATADPEAVDAANNHGEGAAPEANNQGDGTYATEPVDGNVVDEPIPATVTGS